MSGSSIFDVIDALKAIPGFNTSRNSAYGKWLLSGSELGIFARNIIKQYEANKAKEEAKAKEVKHEEGCPAVDGFGCRCGEEA